VPVITDYATDLHEARGIARLARDAHGPTTPWSHQAVLTRTNAQTVVLAEAFAVAGIPARVRGQARFLELPEVRDALRGLQRNQRGLAAGLAALEAAIEPLRAEPIGMDVGEIVDIELTGPELSDAERDRLQNLEELLRLAGEYGEADQTPSTEGFAAWLAATFADDHGDDGGDAVTLTTVHAAKGLEWPVVYIAGLEDGLFPLFYAKTPDAIDEERRLLYVALTRAERALHLSWAAQRGGRTTRRRPSPYLDELEPVLDAMTRGAAPADAATQLPRARAAVQASRGSRPAVGTRPIDPADQPLVDELKQWRSKRSRAANVPAYVVFDDKTLAAIAATRPPDEPSLLSVPGIGPTKLERFGPEVLEIVARHSGA
jgi:DNA helicase-2/ATP-dependent DNA helicase PcrA